MSYLYNILIVDDVSDNIKIAMSILHNQNYNFSFALDGKQALEVVKSTNFDIILLDIMMPNMNGFEVCKHLKSDILTKDIPIIFLTAKSDIDSVTTAFELGAVDYITKPFNAAELTVRVATHIELQQSKKILKQNNLELHAEIKLKEAALLAELKDSQEEIIYVLTELMESNSDETGQHIRRVAEVSRILASLHPDITKEDEKIIFFASPMHDIGKITIPDTIVSCPGKLNEAEFCEMKNHTTNAYNILKYSKKTLLQAASVIAHEHHEKYDGNGYPRGLVGDEIHIYARIVALADVLDALTHKRTYKDSWSFEKSANYIIERKALQFDPVITDLFANNLHLFEKIVKL